MLDRFIVALTKRKANHDLSKTKGCELLGFSQIAHKQKGVEYGSKEYKANLKENEPAVIHHYNRNRHHPEHFGDGISDMTLVDVMEMVADWKAASERTKDGDVVKSLLKNSVRFKIAPQLAAILYNTLEWYGNGS